MTTTRWNAGVATVLSMLLSTMPALQAAASDASGTARDGLDTRAAAASVAIHRIVQHSNRIDVHVESIRGVLVADGTIPGTVELVLTDTRLSPDLARKYSAPNESIRFVEFARSAWGHENEAQITIGVADGVIASVEDQGAIYEIRLAPKSAAGEAFTIRFKETPFPAIAVGASSAEAIRASLAGIADRPEPDLDPSWWAPGAESPARSNRVTAASLTAVRDAKVALPYFNETLFAAQDERAAGEEADSTDDAAAVEEAEEAPPAEVEEAPEPPVKRMPKAPNTAAANKELTRQMISDESRLEPAAPAPASKRQWSGNPLQQPVTIDFRDMDLLNVVQILADMAQINVVAGADLTGPVTLNLRDVPLMQAMETALRLNGLGIVEEQGIYHIKPYLDAIASQRTTEVVEIHDAEAEEIVTTLTSVIQGSEYEALISLSSNKTANTVILAGPEDHVMPLVTLARRLDVEQATLPTVTMPMKLNYAEPADMLSAIEGILTPEVGKVSMDSRARMLIVTDIPIVVEQIQALIEQLDIPVKQVSIDAMIVDVTLTDAADTGVDWIVSAVQSQSRRDAAAGNGINTGNLQELSLSSVLDVGETAGLLNFGILSGDIDWRGVIQAEVRNNNSTLLSNPKLITVENQTATITIASEIPYTELTSTEQGGQQTSTEFKPIGTTLEVTPKVTHDDHIIAQIIAKESTSSQVVNGVPVEDLREINTTPHIASGQTIYVGGLRKNNDTVTVRKVPVLGDVPVVNLLFRSNQRSETVNELLIFLTCSVIDEQPALTAYQQQQADRVRNAAVDVSPDSALLHDAIHPAEFRDPAWKWRKHHKEERMEMKESEPAE